MSSRLQLDVRNLSLGCAIWWMLTEVEAGTVKFAGNTVKLWSVPERFWGGVPRRGAISSVLTFTFTFLQWCFTTKRCYIKCMHLYLTSTFSTNRIYCETVWNISCGAGEQDKHIIKQWNQHTAPRKSLSPFGLGFVKTILSPRLGFLGGGSLAINRLASTDNFTRITKSQNTTTIVHWF